MRFVTKAIKISYFRHFSMVHLQSGKRECIQGVQHCKHSLQYAVCRVQPSIQSQLNFMSTGIIIFQCACNVSQTEFTAHIFTHHCKLKLPDIKCHLRGFVNSHMNWIVKVGANILCKKGIDIYDYVNDLVDLAIPLDQLGLLILARTYHRHITVFCKDYVWTTRSDNAMRDCTAYLVYKGGVNFIDSVPNYMAHSTTDSLKIVGNTPVKTPSNKRKTVSANRITTKRRRRTESDSLSVFTSGFAERQTRNSKREKCRVSLDKVLKQYRSSNRKKKNTKSSVVSSRSTDVSSLDACSYDKFVDGEYSKQSVMTKIS